MPDLSKLRGLLSRVYRGDKSARKDIEDLYALQSRETKKDVSELLDLLEEHEMFPDEVLEALVDEIGIEDAS